MSKDPLLDALRSQLGTESIYGDPYSRVYAATLPGVSTPVDIRVSANGARSAAIMEQEISLRKTLANHPRIVAILKYGAVIDSPYYVVPRIPSLIERRHIKKSMPRAEVIRLVLHIAEALAWCHSVNVVHFSVDPVCIKDEAGSFKLDRFGLAACLRNISASDWEQVVLGNPTYYSPELCFRKSVDFRTDIYSLGAVAYECWSGRLPHADLNPHEMVSAKTSNTLTPLAFETALEQRAAEIIESMLTPKPANRPQSSVALCEAVRSVIADGLAV